MLAQITNVTAPEAGVALAIFGVLAWLVKWMASELSTSRKDFQAALTAITESCERKHDKALEQGSRQASAIHVSIDGVASKIDTTSEEIRAEIRGLNGSGR